MAVHLFAATSERHNGKSEINGETCDSKLELYFHGRDAVHNLAVLKQVTLNLLRLAPIKRKGSIKTRRIIAATSDFYRAELLGLR